MIGHRILVLVLTVGTLAGCSVGLALHGEETPDLSVIKIGAVRDDVELQLGKPYSAEKQNDGGERVRYKYQVGNDPSALRAMGHAALDVASIGLWEIIGTPIEVSVGDEYELDITYDELDQVTKLEQG